MNKSKKRLLAMLLAAAMTVTSLPMAFAEDDGISLLPAQTDETTMPVVDEESDNAEVNVDNQQNSEENEAVTLPAETTEEKGTGVVSDDNSEEKQAECEHVFGAWDFDEEKEVFTKICSECGEVTEEEMPEEIQALLDKLDENAEAAEETINSAVDDGVLTAAAAAYILNAVKSNEPAILTEGEPISLEYDDYYNAETFTDAVVSNEVVVSKQVKVQKTESGYANELAENNDEHVVVVTDGKLHAVGVGTATVTVGDKVYNVTVTPAKLSLFLLAGQSNMEGAEGNAKQSVANTDGTVYASYGKAATLTDATGPSFIPSALSGENRTIPVDKSADATGTNLKGYPVYSLTEEGNGKVGMDGAIAYAWHNETGDKVWVVNAAHSGSSIQSWQPNNGRTGVDDNYSSAVTMFKAAEEVYKAEIEAGHYTAGDMGMFWHQGCSNSSSTAEQYADWFTTMYGSFKDEFEIAIDDTEKTLEFADIALVRRGYNTEACMKSSDLVMTGPRIAQYWMGNNKFEYNGVDLSEINLVCNISDLWVYDEKNMPATVGKYDTVGEFFKTRYQNGKVTYPSQDKSDDSWRTPTVPADVHDSIHYNQVGYNEIGIESATNAAKILNHKTTNNVSVSFISQDGYTPLSENETLTKSEKSKLIVPVVEPLYMAPYITVADGTDDSDKFYNYSDNTTVAVSYGSKELGKVTLGKPEKESYVKYLFTTKNIDGSFESSTDFGSAENAATKVMGTTSFGGKQNETVYNLANDIVLNHDKNWSVEWKQNGAVGGMLLSNDMATTASSKYIWRNGTTGTSIILNVGAAKSGTYLQYGITGIPNTKGIYKLVNEYNAETGKNKVKIYVNGEDKGYLTTRFVSGSPSIDEDGKTGQEYVYNEDGLNGLDMTLYQIGTNNTSFRINGSIAYIYVNEDGAINNSKVEITKDLAKNTASSSNGLEISAKSGESTENVSYQWYKTNATGSKVTAIDDATNSKFVPVSAGYYVCVASATDSPDREQSTVTYYSLTGDNPHVVYLWDFTDGRLTTVDGENKLTPSNSSVVTLEKGKYTSYLTTVDSIGTTKYTTSASAIEQPVVLKHDKNWIVEYKADMQQLNSGMFLLSSSDDGGCVGNNYIWLNSGLKIGESIRQNNAQAYINYGQGISISGINSANLSGQKTVTIKNIWDESAQSRKIQVYVDGELKTDDILAKVGVGGDDNNTAIPKDKRNDKTYLDGLTGMPTQDFAFGYVGANSGFGAIKDLDYLYINTDADASYDTSQDLMAEISTEKNSYTVDDADVKPITVNAAVANNKDAEITYKWFKNNVEVTGNTTNTLTPAVNEKGIFNYKCEVSYNGKTITTSLVKIKVIATDESSDFEWDFNNFDNKTFTADNGNTMQEVIYSKDNKERLSNSNGKFVGTSIGVTTTNTDGTQTTTNVGAVAKMAQPFTLNLNENWTLEWKGNISGGMILSGSQASQAEGNYYIWKSGSKLYVSVAGKSSASAGTAYRNLGKVTLDSGDIVVKIANRYDDNTKQNTISIVANDKILTNDITTKGNAGGDSQLSASELKYIKEHYFSPSNTMKFQYMGVAPAFGIKGNIDYLKVYYTDPCDHSDVSADWKYNKEGYWKECNDCGLQVDYTPYVKDETLIKHPAKTATCAKDGNVAYSEYWVGGTEANGGKVHYFYDDKGLTNEITDLRKTLLPAKGHKYGDWTFEPSESGETYSLTHTCTVCDEKEENHTETVHGATLESLAVSGTYKTDYVVGDELNTDGMVVKGTFKYTDNGVEKTAEAVVTDFEASLDTTTAGTKNITVSFGDKETTAEVKVAKAAYPLTLTADKTEMYGKGTVTLTVAGIPSALPEDEAVSVSCADSTVTVTKKDATTFTVTLPNETKEYTFTITAPQFIINNYDAAANGEDTCKVTVKHKKNSSSGGGSSSYVAYDTTVSDTDNGKLTVSPAKVSEGSRVTITAKADEGYKLDKVTVTDKDGKEITLIKQGDSTFTFVMPKGGADVDAKFVEENAKATEEPKTDDETKDDNNGDETNANPFADVKENDWFYGSVMKAYEEGWMSGTAKNSFAPNTDTTRGMIVTVLYRLENAPEAGVSKFEDVKADAYYDKAVAWAAENGVVSGYSATKFGPDDKITREQLAAILYRYAVLKGYDVSKSADLTAYKDYADVSGYAAEAMAWANAMGIVSGTSETTLSPKANATRAQVAAMLDRFVKAYEK